ncbi:hypothetical protein OR221_1495 [Microbacterium laevaniformans OR221]|jgi:hypothetical protein|nr:hypothetical protein OR221_1495 [Microbacterium laevaniformans OR221]
MTTTLTPPPPTTGAGGPADGSSHGPSRPAGPRPAARVVAILTIVLGAALILGAFGSSALGAIAGAARGNGTLTADAAGIRTLDVDVAAADVSIVYGGDRATLEVDGAVADWHLHRDGDRLVVTTQRSWWSAIRPFGRSDTAVLTLPRSLERVALDGDLTLSAGALRVQGTYGALKATVSAGSMELTGRAAELTADVSAGRLVMDLAGVDRAGFKLSAGSVEGSLTGSAPQMLTADLSAGRLALVLPDVAYAVSTYAAAGNVENRLRVDPSSPHRIALTVSAGFVSLRS